MDDLRSLFFLFLTCHFALQTNENEQISISKEKVQGPNVVAKQVKTLSSMLASYMDADQCPGCSISDPVASQWPRKASGDISNTWTSATHMEDLEEATGCWIWAGLVLAIVALWKVSQ